MKFLVSFLSLAMALAGCSSVQLSPKELHVDRVWVRDPSATPQLGYRKLHQMTPLLFENTVIFGNAIDGLVAYERGTARQLWRLDIKNGVEMGGVIADGNLLIGANDGNFYSIEASTGKVNWSVPIRSEGLGRPAADQNNVYFMAGNHTVYALEKSSGRTIWTYKRVETSSLSIRGNSQPSMSDDSIFIGFNDGFLVGLNKSTGALRWELQLNNNKRFKDIDASPVYENGKLYVSGFDKALFCIDAQAGQVLWQFDQGGYSSVLLSGDQLFYASSRGEMFSLDKNSGKPIWSFKVKEGIATQPILYKGNLVFGESQGSLRILESRTGLALGEYSPGRGVFSSPAVDVDRNVVYFASGEGMHYAVKLEWKTKQSLWAWE